MSQPRKSAAAAAALAARAVSGGQSDWPPGCEQVRLIPRQDLGNIPRIQKGLHARRMSHSWLAADQEKIILNMHRERDRYLGS